MRNPKANRERLAQDQGPPAGLGPWAAWLPWKPCGHSDVTIGCSALSGGPVLLGGEGLGGERVRFLTVSAKEEKRSEEM